MSTTITVTYEQKTYTLEYSRNAVKAMEQQGFVLDQIGDKPMNMVPLLVYGAFQKHHKGIKRALVDEIYEHISDKVGDGEDGFIQVLLEMYSETVNTLTDNNSVDEGNAAIWKVTKGLTFQSYTEVFEQLCPHYMSIGMTYDEFWNQDVRLVEVYRKAAELRDKRRNQELWLQGMYIYEALCDASPLFRFSMKKGTVRPEPYVKEPYPITEAEVRVREEREARAKEERLKAEFALFAERVRNKMSQEARP